MFNQLKGVPRLLLKQELKPVQGERFQPTGFADLGPAVYETHDGTRMLLVESAQSVANHLEKTCLEGAGPEAMKELEGLPYIRVQLSGAIQTTTSSLIEAHRTNSPFIISNEQFQEAFVRKADYAKGRPIAWDRVAGALLYYDPNALLHGVFMANLGDGRVRLPRLVSGFIEARNVAEAASGGVKNNPLDPTGKIRAANYDKDVYGNVPYARMEFTAGQIAAYFNVDLALLASYGLPQEANQLLVALALYKILHFLGSGLRLRTACDLRAEGAVQVQAPPKFDLPTETELLAAVQRGIKACADRKLFADPPVTELTTPCVVKAETAAAPTR